ncbi:hypothetical protein ACFYXH_13635 [Streptomyces sp. NPDC002730]|uniref:hypothetical protein n=1 Tax=Streptomyces sp. NPDC002730 TaxID=3364662 RepID=UPI00367E5913
MKMSKLAGVGIASAALIATLPGGIATADTPSSAETAATARATAASGSASPGFSHSLRGRA